MAEAISYNKDWIFGYKAFFPGLTNQYGEKFLVGNTYGLEKSDNEFHFCKNIEDILLFPPYKNSNNLEFCLVSGKGKTINYENDYCGVYDVYATEILRIIRKIEREEILDYFLHKDVIYFRDRLTRFISLFKLNEEEIKVFKDCYYKSDIILRNILYYQEGDEKAFVRKKVL